MDRGGELVLQHRESRFDANRPHHPTIFMLENVAVIWKRPHEVWVTKIQAQLNAGILGSKAVPVGHIYGVSEIRLFDWHSVPGKDEKVRLMDMKRMRFLGPVFDHPVFDLALAHSKGRDGGRRVKESRRLACFCNVEESWAGGVVGVLRFFGEV